MDGVEHQPKTISLAPSGAVIGAIYARFSTSMQNSIRDQVRTCLEDADRRGIYVPDELIFVDWGISGRNINRPDYLRMKAAAKARKFGALLVFKTNRIARNLAEAVKVVKRELVPAGVRVIFVTQRIDSSGGGEWERVLRMEAFLDDFGANANVHAIRAAHLGQLQAGMKHTILPFGYYGEAVPGVTRLGRPRRRIAIDEPAAEVIRYIFTLRGRDRMKKAAIARRLTAEGVPVPPLVGFWNGPLVGRILRNREYIGIWSYGEFEHFMDDETGTRGSHRRPKPLGVVTHPHTRIVSDELFAEVQRIDEKTARRSGARPNRDPAKAQPLLLSGLLFCDHHGKRLTMEGRSYQCPQCKRDVGNDQPLFSHVPREEAIAAVCKTVAKLILEQEPVVAEAIEKARDSMSKSTSVGDVELREAERAVESLTLRIRRVVADSTLREDDSRAVRRQLESERTEAESRLVAVKARIAKPKPVPTIETVRARLLELSSLLQKYAVSPDPSHEAAVRTVVELVTGGRINVVQVGERRRSKGHARGVFTVNAAAFLSSELGIEVTCEPKEVTMDFHWTRKHMTIADQVKVLWDQGKRLREIGREVKASVPVVSAALSWWYESRGLPAPRLRRKPTVADRMRRESTAPYQKIAAQVGALWESFHTVPEIIPIVGKSRPTVMRALKYWHETQGKPMPNTRLGHFYPKKTA